MCTHLRFIQKLKTRLESCSATLVNNTNTRAVSAHLRAGDVLLGEVFAVQSEAQLCCLPPSTLHSLQRASNTYQHTVLRAARTLRSVNSTGDAYSHSPSTAQMTTFQLQALSPSHSTAQLTFTTRSTSKLWSFTEPLSTTRACWQSSLSMAATPPMSLPSCEQEGGRQVQK